MRNRISFLHRVMGEVNRQRATPAMDAREDIAPIDPGQFPESGATPVQPLQLFVEVDVLRTLVADALEALRWSEARICTTPQRTAAWERAIEQRRRFLNWLGSRTNQKVFLAMYPEYLLNEEVEPGDDDGQRDNGRDGRQPEDDGGEQYA